jgi:hypothetical protein
MTCLTQLGLILQKSIFIHKPIDDVPIDVGQYSVAE